jgi:hypothetical protein
MDAGGPPLLAFEFEAHVIYWRGPSPFFFIPIPKVFAAELRQAAKAVSYGWGMIPIEAEIGGCVFQTALFPKDGTYLLPLKAIIRRTTSTTAGDHVAVAMTVRAADIGNWPLGRPS